MPTAIVTGFEPFRDHATNPSQQIAERLNGQEIGGLTVVSYILPVEFGRDTDILLPAIEALQPALVLSLGLAAGSGFLRVERLAVNLRGADAGRQVPIVAGGPAAYMATIDVDAAGQAACAQGVPARPHVYAGDYLCNHVLYHALHHCAVRGLPTRAGFVHVPLSMEQAIAESRVGSPVLPLESMVRGVRAVLEACA